MIEDKELRVGNLVNHSGFSNAVYVAGLVAGDSRPRVNPSNTDSVFMVGGQWSPIPLTEEWLVKFGFDKKNLTHRSDGSISKDMFVKYPAIVGVNKLNEGDTPFRFCRAIPSEMNGYNFFSFIKYVHQLQNLYFALTGEELTTIELPKEYKHGMKVTWQPGDTPIKEL